MVETTHPEGGVGSLHTFHSEASSQIVINRCSKDADRIVFVGRLRGCETKILGKDPMKSNRCLEWRAFQTQDAGELRRIALDCEELGSKIPDYQRRKDT